MIVIELVYLIGLVLLVVAGFYWLFCTKSDSPDRKPKETIPLKKDDNVVVPDDNDNSEENSVCYWKKEKIE
jgi:hypothetical protein